MNRSMPISARMGGISELGDRSSPLRVLRQWVQYAIGSNTVSALIVVGTSTISKRRAASIAPQWILGSRAPARAA